MVTALALLAVTGCKNDSEQDYLDYLDSLNQPKPGNGDGAQGGNAGTVVLNELDGNEKFIELFNPGSEAVDISGFSLKKDDNKTVYVAPEGTVVDSGAFLVLEGNSSDYSTGFTSGLSADKALKIELFDREGNLLDVFCNPPADPSGTWQDPGTYSGKQGKRSYSRYPDGIGGWFVSESTAGLPNIQGSESIRW